MVLNIPSFSIYVRTTGTHTIVELGGLAHGAECKTTLDQQQLAERQQPCTRQHGTLHSA